MIHCKRVYDPPTDDDGRRVLVDRLWPRGMRKDDLRLDVWCKEAAPLYDRAEYDVVVASGEQVTSGLLARQTGKKAEALKAFEAAVVANPASVSAAVASSWAMPVTSGTLTATSGRPSASALRVSPVSRSIDWRRALRAESIADSNISFARSSSPFAFKSFPK